MINERIGFNFNFLVYLTFSKLQVIIFQLNNKKKVGVNSIQDSISTTIIIIIIIRAGILRIEVDEDYQ